MDDKPEKIETYDEQKRVGILSGKPCEDRPVGPRRRAPMYYAGETYGRHRVQYPDVERYPNGALPGIRNKLMRRLIRKALKRKFSTVETARKLPQAMLEQARLIAKENGKSARFARRLYAQELAIHQTVYAPTKPELRAMRAKNRKLKREGKKDAISQLVDRMAEKR
jgi:hypothetical protein